MPERSTRRRFLQSTATVGAALGASDLAAFADLSPATPAETWVTPDIVRYSPDIEPTVRLMEDTPIEKCPEMLAEQLRRGASYRQLLAGLFLAALRGPSSIAHSVFVIHSAHKLSLDAPIEERLLPLFWALNNYKYWYNWHAQNPDRLSPFKGVLPAADTAEDEFHAAMRQADGMKAEAAMLALLRNRGASHVISLLWPYGAQDCVDVGHCAITVSNVCRVLPTIGWQHAEPMLRWTLHRLISKGDQTYLPNRERVGQAADKLPRNWASKDGDKEVTRELLAHIRDLKTSEACDLVVTNLTESKAHAGAIWDAIHLNAGEVMMRKADDGHSLHANTAANALRHAFQRSDVPADRLLILLQAIGWQCQSRRRKMETDAQWQASTLRIDDLTGAPIPTTEHEATNEILASLSTQPYEAARKAFALSQQHANAQIFQHTARRLTAAKSTVNAHDIKFPIAIFEDYAQVSPVWRPHLLATSVYWLKGSDTPDSTVIQQAREAIRKRRTHGRTTVSADGAITPKDKATPKSFNERC